MTDDWEEDLKLEQEKEKEEEEKKKKEEEEKRKKEEEEEKRRREEEEEKRKKEEEEKRKREEEERKEQEEINKSESIKSQIEEEIKEDEQNKEEQKPNYEINWYTDYLEDLTKIYADYLTTIPNNIKYNYDFPKTAKDFIKGIYPKIIIAKKNNTNNNRIYGICGTYYYIDDNDNNKLILKINHISADETNKDIINKFIDLIENNLEYKIIEIDIKRNINQSNNNNELYEILIEKEFKEYINNEENIILRKEKNNFNEDNINKIGSEINYDSLSVLSLINKNDINIKNNDINYNCFNNIINEINISLLINFLKISNKYKIDIIHSSFESSLIDKISKLENFDYDFIKTKNIDCSNIDEITNNDISPDNNICFSTIKNDLNIQIKTLMTLKYDKYLYNGIQITKNNIIQESKYKSNLYCIPTLNNYIYLLIYQYNDSFEKYLFKNKNNIYKQFISSFKDIIQNFKMGEIEDNDKDNDNKNILWLPSFNIDTNLFSSNLSIKGDINIKDGENDIDIQEYNEYLKINYLPDVNSDKNIKMNISSDKDFIIKDKFILGICHRKFMEYSNIPIISLINVTNDNFSKY